MFPSYAVIDYKHKRKWNKSSKNRCFILLLCSFCMQIYQNCCLSKDYISCVWRWALQVIFICITKVNSNILIFINSTILCKNFPSISFDLVLSKKIVFLLFATYYMHLNLTLFLFRVNYFPYFMCHTHIRWHLSFAVACNSVAHRIYIWTVWKWNSFRIFWTKAKFAKLVFTFCFSF